MKLGLAAQIRCISMALLDRIYRKFRIFFPFPPACNALACKAGRKERQKISYLSEGKIYLQT